MDSIPPAARPTGSDKLWSIFSHLSAFTGVGFIVLPLVVYLVMRRESAYVAENAREALNFHLSALIYSLCSILLVFALIGIPLLWVIGVCTMVLAIVAAVKASFAPFPSDMEGRPTHLRNVLLASIAQ